MFPEAVILVREAREGFGTRLGLLVLAGPPAARPRGASRPRAITSLKLRTRKTNTSEAKPMPKVSAPIAICWPTE